MFFRLTAQSHIARITYPQTKGVYMETNNSRRTRHILSGIIFASIPIILCVGAANNHGYWQATLQDLNDANMALEEIEGLLESLHCFEREAGFPKKHIDERELAILEVQKTTRETRKAIEKNKELPWYETLIFSYATRSHISGFKYHWFLKRRKLLILVKDRLVAGKECLRT